MREIKAEQITKTVKALFIEANYHLPEDAEGLIVRAAKCERNPLAKEILSTLTDNLAAAREMDIPICQDTGLAVIFVELGKEVHITGGEYEEAIEEGVRLAYTEGYLRKSVVRDPLFDRVNTGDNTPPVIHTRIVPGDKIKITAAPKGFGSENMSALKMFTPSAGREYYPLCFRYRPKRWRQPLPADYGGRRHRRHLRLLCGAGQKSAGPARRVT